jgi:acetylornithine deacetylase/succinyl-diaminopimelate desuccinylase-like protein
MARGAVDDKAMASIWVDTLVRFKHEGYRPRRTLKLALTCGEEGGFDGAEYLARNKRDLIDAAFAAERRRLRPAGRHGKPIFLAIRRRKAVPELRSGGDQPGGHSSRPMPDNAIYHLANALVRIQAIAFR